VIIIVHKTKWRKVKGWEDFGMIEKIDDKGKRLIEISYNRVAPYVVGSKDIDWEVRVHPQMRLKGYKPKSLYWGRMRFMSRIFKTKREAQKEVERLKRMI
jgi:hypothetical protein